MKQYMEKENNIKCTIGVDIGLHGGMSIINGNNEMVECVAIPTIDVLVGKKIRQHYDIGLINDIINRWISLYRVSIAGFERLRAIPNQRSQVAFSMGGGAMMFKTLFTIHKIPFMEVEPRSWQKKIFGDLGIQYNKDTTKKASIQAAKQLFPGELFLATERSRVASDGLTDSILISLYISQQKIN